MQKFVLLLSATVAFYVSLVGICSAQNPILDNIDERIEQHRKRTVTVTFQRPDGTPVPAKSAVKLELYRHAFLFGSNLFRFDDLDNAQHLSDYRRHFAGILNYATLPFYWEYYEQQPDRLEFANRAGVATWCRNNGIIAKGHTLFWALEPKWLQRRSDAEARLFGRIEREARDFKGLVQYWDVLNEPVENVKFARERGAHVAARAYERYGTQGVIQKAFHRAQRGNPTAKFVLNDFILDEKFERIIAGAIANEVPIAAIGIQSHMHNGYWGHQKLWDVCERFGKFAIPIHFTEVTILSGRNRISSDNEHNPEANRWYSTREGEELQKQHVREMYHVLFSHPAVEAISWWDFTDKKAWMGAPAGLIDANMKPKPAYWELQSLIKNAWTTKLETNADTDGAVRFRGFHGDYQCGVTVDGQFLRGNFRIPKNGDDEIMVTLR